MASDDLLQEFLMIIGKTYESYGYPEFCGWIEGLLMFEQREWTQRGISKRLGEIFPAGKHPTSVPSVNRALKVLEGYGILEKSGSRKTGFRYSLIISSNLVYSMFQQLLLVNQDFIGKMEALSSRARKSDSSLKRAIRTQIENAKLWNEIVEGVVESLGEKVGE